MPYLPNNKPRCQVVLILFFWVVATLPVVACESGTLDLRWTTGGARFQVEIADTQGARSKGLMFRETLGRYNGMLFVYERPQRVSFWMKNTHLPLDLLFFDRRGRLMRIVHNARPHSLESIDGGSSISSVLEINGGMAQALGIKAGAEMRHPSLSPQNAAWPCGK